MILLKRETMGTQLLQQLMLLAAVSPAILAAFNDYNSDKILLSDVKVLTLHQGRMTNARRSPPVPQLKCMGGSAQHKFQPRTVQCINRGSDGIDIQWECKTDMDNNYRFGHVEVTCEGYDYPNDPFVLKGSCGLEYTIEFTEEGLERERKKGSYYQYQPSYQYKSEGGIGGLFVLAAILFAIYCIYKTCLAPPPTRPGTQSQQQQQQPPPYGFREEYMPQGPPPTYESTQQSSSSSFPGSDESTSAKHFESTHSPNEWPRKTEQSSHETSARHRAKFSSEGSSTPQYSSTPDPPPYHATAPPVYPTAPPPEPPPPGFNVPPQQPSEDPFLAKQSASWGWFSQPPPAASPPPPSQTPPPPQPSSFSSSSASSPTTVLVEVSSGTRTASGFGGTKRR